MRRRVLKALCVVIALLSLAIAVPSYLLLRVDLSSHVKDLAELVASTTGRHLAVNGRVNVALSPAPHLIARDVTFSNPPWATEPHLFSAKRLDLKLSVASLLKGEIDISRIVLVEPRVTVEFGPQGQSNWAFSETKGPASDNTALGFNIQELRVHDGKIAIRNETAPMQWVIKDGVARTTAPSAPVQLDIAGAYRQAPFKLTGNLGSLESLLAQTPYMLDLLMVHESFALKAKGGVGGGLGVALTTDLDTKNMAKAVAFITDKAAVPATRARIKGDVKIQGESILVTGLNFDGAYPLFGDAPTPVQLKADVHLKGQVLKLTKARASLLGNHVGGSVVVNTAKRIPSVHATLKAKMINLTKLFGDAQGVKKATGRRMIPELSLALPSLKGFTGTIKLNAQTLRYRNVKLAKVRLDSKLQRGVLNLKINANGFGGTLQSASVVRASGKSTDIRTNLTTKGTRLGDIASAIGKPKVVSGAPTNFNASLSGKGVTLREWLAGADGDLKAVIGGGRIYNGTLDLAGADAGMALVRAVNPLSKDEDVTDLKCGVAIFNVRNGIARSKEGLAAQTSKINLFGSGVVNLRTEAIDLGIKPEPREGIGIGAGSITRMVRLQGTLMNPTPAVDTKGALKTGASLGVALATGGLSLLAEGIFNRATAKDDPCRTALAGPSGTGRSENTFAKMKKKRNTTRAVKPAGRGSTEGN